MGSTIRNVLSLVATLSAIGSNTVASAQDAGDNESLDEEARAVFTAGNTAFGDARYADALEYFQRAYELSGRPALLYNIAIAADRVRQDEIALESFERFLDEVPEHPRRRDAEARVEVLRREIEARAASEDPEGDGTASTTDLDGAPAAGADGEAAASVVGIAGGSTLIGLGVAGVVAGVIGIAGADDCLNDAGGVCLERRETAWGAVGAYAGLGLAAIAGGVVWLVLSLGGESESEVAELSRGVLEGWSF